MNKNTEQRDFCISWWLIFITVICIHAEIFLIPASLAANHPYKITFLTELSILLPIAIGGLNIYKRSEIKEIGLRKFNPWLIPVLFILPFITQIYINAFMAPFNMVLDFLFNLGEQNKIPQTLSESIFGILAVCILAPVLEEFLLRGIIMHYLKKYGIIINIAISSLAFAILHFSPDTFIVMFFLGVLLGVIRVLTNSIWPCIIAHSANNFFAYILMFAPEFLSESNIYMIVLSIILFPVAFCLLIKLSSNTCREYISNKKAEKPGLSVGMILCLIIYAFYMIVIMLSKLSSYITNLLN